MAFLDFLIEDYADEWVTKAMYHYRWTYAPDIAKAGRLLPLNANLATDAEALAKMSAFITDRRRSTGTCWFDRRQPPRARGQLRPSA
ncbi:MAG: hypothetical protein R2706_09580 [Acidimicrobiales bacterium]